MLLMTMGWILATQASRIAGKNPDGLPPCSAHCKPSLQLSAKKATFVLQTLLRTLWAGKGQDAQTR